jgi:hypothetical protein
MIQTHGRGAGVARGVEGAPGIAGAVAADLLADRIPTYLQDRINTVLVPYSSAAEAVFVLVARVATDVVDAGITSLTQVVTQLADAMPTRGLRLGRDGPGQPAQTGRNQQPVEA